MGRGVKDLRYRRERVCDAPAMLYGLFLVVFVDELREGAEGLFYMFLVLLCREAAGVKEKGGSALLDLLGFGFAGDGLCLR